MKFKRGIWLTSDLHVGHWNCNRFDNRGFETLDEMNTGIINSINEYVKVEDTLYLIGDAVWSTCDHSILKRINCKNIILIRGNHCDSNYNKFYKNGINVVCEGMILKIAGERVILSHYPYKYGFWKSLYSNLKNFFRKGYWPSKKRFEHNPINKGQFLIHGHHHLPENYINDKQFNVSWSKHKRPINIQEIESFIGIYKNNH